MFSTPFKNGKTYADCFPNKGIGIRQNYPYFDEKEGKVVTLELALNRCRENGLMALPCGERSVRFCPPLNLTRAEADEGLDIVQRSLRSL